MDFKKPIVYILIIFFSIILVMIVKFWGLTEEQIINNKYLIEYWSRIRSGMYLISFFGFFIFIIPSLFISETENYLSGIRKNLGYLFLFIVLVNISYWVALNVYISLDYYFPIT